SQTHPSFTQRVLRCLSQFAVESSSSVAHPMELWRGTSDLAGGHVVIVDAYSSGNLLAQAFRARGHEVLHMRSGMKISERLKRTFVRDDFKDDFDPDGRVDNAISMLDGKPVVLVIPGSESGVTFAETLATKMGTPTNDPNLIDARRNKIWMARALSGKGFEEHGLYVPRQEFIYSPDEAVRWVRAHLGTWSEIPGVVVKPILGAGGSQVHLVGSDAELRAAVAEILAEDDHFGMRNIGAIVSEKIVGDEFALNGAVLMHNGSLEVALTDAWYYNKHKANGSAPKYGHEDLVAFETLHPQVYPALRAGLSALGYLRGGFHQEVIVQEGTGRLYFIEVGPRLYGAGNPRIAGTCTNYGQVRALVDSYLAQAHFLQHTGKPYELSAHASVFNVNAPASEVPLYVNAQHIPMLRQTLGSSLFEILPFFNDGDTIRPTVDLGSTLFQIEIRHRDRRIVDGFIRYLAQWQSDGYFWRSAP
ncbi:MAG: ATP-grasp domain-containing protein, partial [Bdellovibrionales bacterium]|nr:ATP-grasp domain-containing protein [Bdellovibrionales bacterium]